MKISNKMFEALDEQVSHEADASQLYLAMATWCESSGYPGAAKFFYNRSEEEREHMMKVIRYINKIGAHATIPGIKQPPVNYDSFEAVFQLAYENEKDVTASVNKTVNLSKEEKDHFTFNFLQWLVDEQLEEEQMFESILTKIKLIGLDGRGIYLLDKEISDMDNKVQ